jgi:hypothetical protein
LSAFEFFDQLSSITDLHELADLVTPRFYNYLADEFALAGDYRPVFDFNRNNFDPILDTDLSSTVILLGEPALFRHLDTYEFIRPDSPPLTLRKTRPPKWDLPEPYYDIIVKKYCAGTLIGVAGTPLGGLDLRLGKRGRLVARMLMAQLNRDDILAKGNKFSDREIVRLTENLVRLWETPGWEGSLACTFTLSMTLSGRVKVLHRQTKEVVAEHPFDRKSLYITFRSNHVTPGEMFNSETVRWYVDDVNFTIRDIPWMEHDGATRVRKWRISDIFQ